MAVSSAQSLAHCNHLIIVCCHAIYSGGPNHGASEDEWLVLQLDPRQALGQKAAN